MNNLIILQHSIMIRTVDHLRYLALVVISRNRHCTCHHCSVSCQPSTYLDGVAVTLSIGYND